jgi:putative ABC transport system permease protein
MPYLTLALKNIFRDPKRSFTLGINYFFVAILLLIVFSITNGVKKNITSNVIASAAGHITISGEYIVNGRTYQGISGYQRVDSLIRRNFPEARIVTRYTLSSAVYYNGLSKRLSFVGIDPHHDTGLRDQISIDDQAWNAFVNNTTMTLFPRSISEYFGVEALDDILIATRTRFGAFNTGTMRISGLYTTGNYFLRGYVISNFSFLRSLDLADSITASKMYVFFNDLAGIDKKRDRLLTLLNESGFHALKPASGEDAINAVSAASPRYTLRDDNLNERKLTVATIDEVTGILSKVIAAINATGLLVAAIMLFIIAVSIFINMRMTINERMQEIGTLRAMGAERGDVTALFIVENVALSLVFILSGIVTGLLLITIFQTAITFPADGVLGLFLNKGHFVLRPTVAAIASIVTLLVTLTAVFSFFPARYGAKIPPVTALNVTM